MDNLTHSLAGWALGQAGLKTKTRKGLAALILAANMPDIDVFFGHSCWDPLATHRGVTHSLVGGFIVMPPVLAGLLWLLDRWQVRRGAVFESRLPMHFGWLVALCYIGTVTHPLLDLQTTYAIQLFSPFTDRWFHTESLFIIDVWIWIVLGLAIWLSRRRERARGDWHFPARAGLTLVVAYIGANLVLTAQAERQLARTLGYRPERVFAGLEPFRFWKRGLVWRQDGGIADAAWTPFGGLGPVSPSYPDNMGDPLVRRAAFSTDALRRFMHWSVMPVAVVERRACSARVTFSDARFGTARLLGKEIRNPFHHVAVVPVDGPGCGKRKE
ncbi:MAG: metal-dependent hydrolase [Novosphingobium sp.]|nr:metal-dependent hydrolase [Novosphingobium sp.]